MMLFEGLDKLFNCPSTVKVIVTENSTGGINVDFRNHLYLDPNGMIFLFEVAEYTSLSCNLTYSLWFGRNVVIGILGDSQQAYEIQANVQRTIVSGNEFKKACEWMGEDYERYDLSSVWILEPLQICDSGCLSQIQNERTNKPLIAHLDRLARKERHNE